MAETEDLGKPTSELLLDAFLRHMVGLQRYSGGLDLRTRVLLDAVESDLARAIRKRLRAAKGLERPSDVARMKALLADVRRIRGQAWDRVAKLWKNEARELAVAEARAIDAAVRAASPTVIPTRMPPIPTLRSIATGRPFEGALLSQWAKKARRSDVERIERAIKIGMAQGESVPDIVRRVVGGAVLKGRDGVTALARNDAAAVVRTATSYIASSAQRAWIEENPGIVARELFVATLDARTTPICQATDGKIFKAGKGPTPPLHWRCRSWRVPLLSPEAVGERPAKASTERGLLREFAAQRGFDAPASRDGLPHGTKTAFDRFARRRVRELTSRVPAKTTYQQWLKRQPASFQDDVLGKAKGKLFRRGGIALDRFVDERGRELTLAELAKIERRAFSDAGLDLSEFSE